MFNSCNFWSYSKRFFTMQNVKYINAPANIASPAMPEACGPNSDSRYVRPTPTPIVPAMNATV